MREGLFVVRLVRLLAVSLALVGCSRDLQLPDPPTPKEQPVLSSFAPQAAYSGDRVVIYGENFDPSGNQLIFAAGISVFALSNDAGLDLVVDGGTKGPGLVFEVPVNLKTTEKLVLTNTLGRSAPSEEYFYPLGNGYPNVGAPLATLKFRHAPVGIVDRLENVLMASSLFDIVLTDGKAFASVPGEPLSLVPVPANRDQAFLSVKTESGSAVVLVSAEDGTVIASSTPRDIVDEKVLPGVPPSVGRSIGYDRDGNYALYDWKYDGTALTSSPRRLPIRQLLGANALGPDVVVVGYGENTGPLPETFLVPLLSNIVTVFPHLPDGGFPCTMPDDVSCSVPDGPVALVPQADGGSSVVVSLDTGDLAVVDARQPSDRRELTLISYARIDDLAASVGTDKVVFSKSRDGALFQYDLTTDELDWAVPVRGEPTVISVAPDIDEVAVANRTENSVDTIVASSGQWSGRIAFDLGLGAAPGHTGGVKATYSYDPARSPPVPPPDTFYPDETMDLLMRNIGLVLTFNASSLELGRMSVLQPPDMVGPPLRLLVMQQSQTGPFETMVLHQLGVGLLEDDSAGGMRSERIVTANAFPETPTDALVMPDGSIVIAFPSSVRSYVWAGLGTNRMLQLAGVFSAMNGNTVGGIARKGANVIVVEVVRGGRFNVTERRLRGLEQLTSVTINASSSDSYSDFVRAVNLREGPALLFGDALVDNVRGPAVWFPSDDLPSAPSIITGQEITGVSPDGRFLVWRDVNGPEPMIRLTFAEPNGSVSAYSTYRLASQPAGGDFDPSGQWLFLPLPGTDQLDVVQ